MTAFESKICVGEKYKFGSYKQNINEENGGEEIEWIVLEKDGSSALLLADKALDVLPYNTDLTDVTWEICTLRKWLNIDFLNSAFTAEERQRILTTELPADKNPNFISEQGNVTKDKIFLLSIADVNKYFSSNAERMCVPTAYTRKAGAYIDAYSPKNGETTCWWWLRSIGFNQQTASAVGIGGAAGYLGDPVNYMRNAVRPALRITVNP